ncbi:conserved Plasmodium protein, unknown function [Plasmodium gallinaceum]|uniref:Uncharacterized protein n=1 Tax=Plasmodium gallinaceum TaxID=5849 RepID=A0A1J1GVT6_PLAGA|nr:conserved Plasmodium protein, unknown function [Plasmodium gallinaceum]CRG96666.1 conserved Plasmodium protein, unknown function [Plasmodium gallinaceum]
MEVTKTFVPLIIGSYGLCLSSYLIYKKKKKNNWQKINGYIDHVALKYTKNFLQEAFYLNVKYYFHINNEKIENSKEYKIWVNIFKNKSTQNIVTNGYTQNIFDQISKEKNIHISYNPNNFRESEPLIYIYENDILLKYKLLYKIKSKLINIKMYFSKNSDTNKAKNFLNKETEYKKELEEKNKIEKANTENNTLNLEDTNENFKLSDYKKKLIDSYDINNKFPIYMFSCSLFLILSFFLKKRIIFVSKELSQKNISKNVD